MTPVAPAKNPTKSTTASATKTTGRKATATAAPTAAAATPAPKPASTVIEPELPTEGLTKILITPELAEVYLGRMAANRSLNEAHADRLAVDMKNGDWRQTYEPVRFNKKGELTDGQHRLAAVIRSGKAQEFWVASGLDAKAMSVTDTGRSRTFADVQAIAGEKNARKLAAVAKQVYYLDIGKATASGPAVSHAQLDRTVKAHEGLRDAVEKVAAVSGIQPHAQIAAVYCLAREKHPRKADQWLEALQEGENLAKGSPALVVRNKLISNRGTGAKLQLRGPSVAAFLINGWNAFLANEKGVTAADLQWRNTRSTATDEFPEIL